MLVRRKSRPLNFYLVVYHSRCHSVCMCANGLAFLVKLTFDKVKQLAIEHSLFTSKKYSIAYDAYTDSHTHVRTYTKFAFPSKRKILCIDSDSFCMDNIHLRKLHTTL